MAIAVHGTLTANTVDTVTLPNHVSAVTVINRGGTGGPFEIYFVTDGQTTCAILGTNNLVVPAVVGAEQSEVTTPQDPVDHPESQGSVIQLVSSGAAAFSIIA